MMIVVEDDVDVDQRLFSSLSLSIINEVFKNSHYRRPASARQATQVLEFVSRFFKSNDHAELTVTTNLALRIPSR
jgi:hypothetical protein